MTSRDEDDAWRAIVENYGDRPRLDTASAPPTEPEGAPDGGSGVPFDPELHAPAEPEVPAFEEDDLLEEERFIPLPLPPAPVLSPARRAAWAAVLGAPLLLMVTAFSGWNPPTLVSLAMVGAFLAGFAYLVANLPAEPPDPWDNGAQL